MPFDGFMIAVNQADFQSGGQRGSNWCKTTAWWANENVFLVDSAGNQVTTPRVGEAVTIQVGFQGIGGVMADAWTATIQQVQAWICHPSTTIGLAGTVLLSSQANPPSADIPVSVMEVGPGSGYYGAGWTAADVGGSAPPYALVSLSPAWTPSVHDLLSPNTGIDCCVVVTGMGTADDNSTEQTPFGALGLDSIDICENPYQAQRNVVLAGLPVRGPITGPFRLGFLVANPNQEGRRHVTLDARPLDLSVGIDTATLRRLHGTVHGDISLQPAPAEAVRSVRVTANAYEQAGRVRELIREAEEIIDEVLDDVGQTRVNRAHVTLPPGGVQPMLLEIAFDDDMPVGSVSAVDVTETDGDGERGGLRVVVVRTPVQ
jgi:hypothetical protein